MKQNYFLCHLLLLFSGKSYAGTINLYGYIAGSFGLHEKYQPVLSFLLAFFVCFALGFYFKRYINQKISSENIDPSRNLSLFVVLEEVIGFLVSLTKEHCGHYYKSLSPLLVGVFVFILVNNLSGLIPGLPPATENISSNLAVGLVVFLVYNAFGFKEHGFAYLKQFMGPFVFLAPLFIVLETISHCVRPMSLALRLAANIFGDHLLLGVFTDLVPFLIPALLLFVGLLVSVIQSFVFTLLTGIYVNMAISHDH